MRSWFLSPSPTSTCTTSKISCTRPWPVVPDADEFVDMGPLLEHYLISEAQWQPMESVGMLAGAPSGWHAVVRRGSDPYTQRYTLAHELGHWLLFHRCGIDSEEAKRLGLYHEVEELCDVFAALTLVTREAVQRLLEGQGTVTFATLATCARRAKVPIRAVLYRLATFPSGFRTSGRVLVFRADGISNKLVLALDALAARSGVGAQAGLAGDYQLVADRDRSEERRVGKECRSRWSPYD